MNLPTTLNGIGAPPLVILAGERAGTDPVLLRSFNRQRSASSGIWRTLHAQRYQFG